MSTTPANYTYGVTHVFGIYGTENFITIQSDDLTQRQALDVEVTDETGRVITNRLDDIRLETTISGVLKDSATIPTVGNQLTYNGTSYIIKDVTNNGTNNGFRKVSCKLVKYQLIS
jgi:hypothetical protein